MLKMSCALESDTVVNQMLMQSTLDEWEYRTNSLTPESQVFELCDLLATIASFDDFRKCTNKRLR